MKHLLLGLALITSSLCAQDWVPARVVAITDYPRLAWIAQQAGDVAIRCTLDKDGSVLKAESLSGKSSLLTHAAIENALLWKFHHVSPKKPNNAGGSVMLTFQFRLEGGPKDTPHCSFVVDLPNIVHVTAQPPVPMID